MDRVSSYVVKFFTYVWPEIIVVLLSYPVGLLSGMGAKEMVILTLLLIGQNVSFTIVSRARQSANLKLHTIAAIGSNGFYIFVITTIVQHYGSFWLKFWYIVCTVVGSVHAHHISLHKIEKSKSFRKDSLVTREEFERTVGELRAQLTQNQTGG